MKVSCTGSAALERLTPEIKKKLDEIIKLSATILIGNYKGFDILAINYLSECGYQKVEVYETGTRYSKKYPIFDIGKYPAQDLFMCAECDRALAVQYREDRGVQKNIDRLKGRVEVIEA